MYRITEGLSPIFRYHEEVLSLQPMFQPKPLDIFTTGGGCSEGLDAFRFFLNTTSDGRAPKLDGCIRAIVCGLLWR